MALTPKTPLFAGSPPPRPVNDLALAHLMVKEASSSQVLSALEAGVIDVTAVFKDGNTPLTLWMARFSSERREGWWSLPAQWPTHDEWTGLKTSEKQCWVAARMIELGADIFAGFHSKWSHHSGPDNSLDLAVQERMWPIVDLLDRHPRGAELPWRRIDLEHLIEKGSVEAAVWLSKRGAKLDRKNKQGVPAWMKVKNAEDLKLLANAGVYLNQSTTAGQRAEAYWSATRSQKEASVLIEKIRGLRQAQGHVATAQEDAETLRAELEQERKGMLTEWIKSGRINPVIFRLDGGETLAEWQVEDMAPEAWRPQNGNKRLPVLAWFASAGSPGGNAPMPDWAGLSVSECLLLLAPMQSSNMQPFSTPLKAIAATLPADWLAQLAQKLSDMLERPDALDWNRRVSVAMACWHWAQEVQTASTASVHLRPAKGLPGRTPNKTPEGNSAFALEWRRLALRWMAEAYDAAPGLDKSDVDRLIKAVSHLRPNYGYHSGFGSVAMKAWEKGMSSDKDPLRRERFAELAMLELVFSEKDHGDVPANIKWAIEHGTPTAQGMRIASILQRHDKENWAPEGWAAHAQERILDQQVSSVGAKPARTRL